MSETTTERPAVLCFVRPPWAYFTRRPLAEQTGDDWHKRYYATNSCPPEEEVGVVFKVAYDGSFESPAEWMGVWDGGCHLSVNAINGGGAAWLLGWSEEANQSIVIPPGTTFDEFIRRIEQGGGKVYVPLVQLD